MDLQKCPLPLQNFGRWLLGFLHELTGSEPDLVAKWYQAKVQGRVCLYVYFIGNRGSGHHKNSAHLAALWHEDFLKFDWVEKKNNWFGKPSADCYLGSEDAQSKDRAEVFIRHAFRSVAVKVYQEAAHSEADRKTFEKDSGVVVNPADRTAQNQAAKRLREMIGKVGGATALFLRDVLVNVVSDVVRKALRGV